MIHAAFANTEYKLKKLTALLGLRGEHFSESSLNTQLGSIGEDELKDCFFYQA
jgi:hypothetical protein